MLLGNLNAYTETNFNRVNDIYYNTYGLPAGFVEGEPALDLELGIRITHFAPWADIWASFSVLTSKYNSSCTDAILRLPVEQARLLGPDGRIPDRGAIFSRGSAPPRSATRPCARRMRRYYSSANSTGLNVSAGMQTIT